MNVKLKVGRNLSEECQETTIWSLTLRPYPYHCPLPLRYIYASADHIVKTHNGLSALDFKWFLIPKTYVETTGS